MVSFSLATVAATALLLLGGKSSAFSLALLLSCAESEVSFFRTAKYGGFSCLWLVRIGVLEALRGHGTCSGMMVSVA
uniref:Putative secreted peptide n=1 Tax=Anopheles braziliensis TaxID=58242 RepID=A0A2M3ZV66_9DIPT